MNGINNSTAAMLSYYGSQLANRSSSAGAEGDTQTTQDPLADLRRFAKQMVARSEGGLLRAMQGAMRRPAACSEVWKAKRRHLR